MWDIPQLYVSACSNSVQLVPLHPIIISILFHHFEELKECISEVDQIVATTTHEKLRIDVEEEAEEPSLYSYFLVNNESTEI